MADANGFDHVQVSNLGCCPAHHYDGVDIPEAFVWRAIGTVGTGDAAKRWGVDMQTTEPVVRATAEAHLMKKLRKAVENG